MELLTLCQKKNFRLVQTEIICRQQNKCDQKLKFAIGRVENVGKEENDGLTSIFSFSNNIYKKAFPTGHQVIMV